MPKLREFLLIPLVMMSHHDKCLFNIYLYSFQILKFVCEYSLGIKLKDLKLFLTQYFT